MKIAAVTITHNSRADLPDLLASIPAQVGPHPVELIVVDSGSTDDSLAVAAAERPDARLVDLGGNRGYAAGVNAGWQAADAADAMLLLNPDLTVDAGALDPWLAALDQPGVGIVAPRIRNLGGDLEWSQRRRPSAVRAWSEAVLGGGRAARLGLSEMVTEPDAYETRGAPDWASGAAMAISRACLDAVGPWDERFFLFSEETDFCLRAGALDFGTVYEPAASVMHRGGEFATSPPLYALTTWNRVRLHRKHAGRAATALFRAGVTVGEVIRSITARPRDVHRAALRGLTSARRRRTILPPQSHLEWSGAN